MTRVDAWLRTGRSFGKIIWPSQCVLCCRAGQVGRDLCTGCEADLQPNEHCCALCAEPFEGGPHHREPSVCGACLQHLPRFDASFIPYRYAYPVDHMIRRLKYGGALAMGRVLGELFAHAVSARLQPESPALVPVPLGHDRFRQRGYNQAIVIAEHIARIAKLPVCRSVLFRTRETIEQAGLDQRERRKNIRGAFALAATPPAHVAIVDDVVTTGSTANEIARVLKSAGVKRVEVWAVARAGR